MEKVKIIIKEARGLPTREDKDSLAYVRVCLGHDQKTTGVRNTTVHPLWNETFNFLWNKEESSGPTGTLEVEVYFKDQWAADEYIGGGSVEVATLLDDSGAREVTLLDEIGQPTGMLLVAGDVVITPTGPTKRRGCPNNPGHTAVLSELEEELQRDYQHHRRQNGARNPTDSLPLRSGSAGARVPLPPLHRPRPPPQKPTTNATAPATGTGAGAGGEGGTAQRRWAKPMDRMPVARDADGRSDVDPGRPVWELCAEYAAGGERMCMASYRGAPKVVVNDPQLLVEVLGTNSDRFIKGQPWTSAARVYPSTGVCVAPDATWASTRATHPLSQQGMRRWMAAQVHLVREVVQQHHHKLSSESPFDISTSFQRLAFDTMWRCLWGDPLPTDDTYDLFLTLADENAAVIRAMHDAGFTPDSTVETAKDRWVQLHAALFRKVTEDVGDGTSDLASTVIRGTLGRAPPGPVLQGMLVECLFAGVMPVATILSSMLYLLSDKPELRRALENEVRDTLTAEGTSTTPWRLATLESMRLLHASILEALRLLPPHPFISRRANGNVDLDGYLILDGTEVFLAPWHLHRDPTHWGSDSDVYDPYRWLRNDGELEVENPLNSSHFLPFGYGARSCMGAHMAMFQARTIMVSLLAEDAIGIVQPASWNVDWFAGVVVPHGLRGIITGRAEYHIACGDVNVAGEYDARGCLEHVMVEVIGELGASAGVDVPKAVLLNNGIGQHFTFIFARVGSTVGAIRITVPPEAPTGVPLTTIYVNMEGGDDVTIPCYTTVLPGYRQLFFVGTLLPQGTPDWMLPLREEEMRRLQAMHPTVPKTVLELLTTGFPGGTDEEPMGCTVRSLLELGYIPPGRSLEGPTTLREFDDLLQPQGRGADYDDAVRWVQRRWRTDAEFGRQFVAGSHPNTPLRRLTSWPPLFDTDSGLPLLAEVLRSLRQGQHRSAIVGTHMVEAELSVGRFFSVDYTHVAPWSGWVDAPKVDPHDTRRRYMPAVLCIMWLDPMGGLGHPVPVAIQVLAEDKSWHVYSPLDTEWDWLYAKMCVQCVDGVYHLAVSRWLHRLCSTTIAHATHRCLPCVHPVFKFLHRHLYPLWSRPGRLPAQFDFLRRVLTVGGRLPKLVQSAYSQWRFTDMALPTQLSKGRTADPGDLPFYPYRDDATPVWESLVKYTTQYIRAFYGTDSAVEDDREVQAWWSRCHATHHREALPHSTGLHSTDALIDVLVIIAWMTSAQQNACDVGSDVYYSVVPNRPLLLFAAPQDEPIDESNLVAALPDTFHTLQTMWYLKEGCRREGEPSKCLGEAVEQWHPRDTAVEDAEERFRRYLHRAHLDTRDRNKEREMLYTPLVPGTVPNCC